MNTENDPRPVPPNPTPPAPPPLPTQPNEDDTWHDLINSPIRQDQPKGTDDEQ